MPTPRNEGITTNTSHANRIRFGCSGYAPSHSHYMLTPECLAFIHECLAFVHECLAVTHECSALVHECLALVHERLALVYECLAVTHECLAVTHECLAVTHECLAVTHECSALVHECLAVTHECLEVAASKPVCSGRRAAGIACQRLCSHSEISTIFKPACSGRRAAVVPTPAPRSGLSPRTPNFRWSPHYKIASHASVVPKSWQRTMKVSLFMGAFNLGRTPLPDALPPSTTEA